jgi:DNA-binding NtrC family response regulator
VPLPAPFLLAPPRDKLPSLSPPGGVRFDQEDEVTVTLDGQLQRIIDELVSKGIPLETARKEFERKYVATAVTRSSGNLGQAAKSLGIHRNTLRAKISLLRLKPPLKRRDHA